MARGRRQTGAGRGKRRHDGLGRRRATVSAIVTPITVIEGGRDIVFTLLNGTVDTGGDDGVIERGRDLIYNELNGSIPEV